MHTAFSTCISQFGNGAYLASEYIAGQSVNRDFKGNREARTTRSRRSAVPSSARAAKMLVEQILSDKSFQFSPAAQQADRRDVAGQRLLLLWRRGLPDLPADPQPPGDRARPLPRLERGQRIQNQNAERPRCRIP